MNDHDDKHDQAQQDRNASIAARVARGLKSSPYRTAAVQSEASPPLAAVPPPRAPDTTGHVYLAPSPDESHVCPSCAMRQPDNTTCRYCAAAPLSPWQPGRIPTEAEVTAVGEKIAKARAAGKEHEIHPLTISAHTAAVRQLEEARAAGLAAGA